MDTFKKSHEIQMQVRHNAEEMRNTLNDLYSWEQEMKAKEKEMRHHPSALEKEELKNVPVRSHILAEKQTPESNKGPQQHQKSSTKVAKESKSWLATTGGATTPTEKREAPLDPNEGKRKQANEIKDRGNKYVKLGEYEKAIHEYTTAIDIFPEDAVFYSNRALCYLKLERYNECIENCERAIEIDSSAVKAYYRRMQANESLGNNMDALKDCTTVLMMEPKNSEANKSLERINERLRKNANSLKGPNFSAPRDNMIDILPIDKPPYKRSNKPLRRVSIADVVGPKDTKNCDNYNLKISDEDIDKLFNSNCGPFVEVKKGSDVKSETVEMTATKQSGEKVAEKLESLDKDIASSTAIEENRSSKTKNDKIPSIAIGTKNYSPTTRTSVLLMNANRSLPPPPTSTAQFYSNWKELAPEQKYQYMKSIDITQIRKILGAGFDSDTLTDILQTIRDFYLPHGDETTAATLLEVSKSNQVAILSLLMSAEERKVINQILNAIKENEVNIPAAELITKNFNLH